MLGGPERPVGGLSVRPPAGVEIRPCARDDLPAVLRLLAERSATPGSDVDAAPVRQRWEAAMRSVDFAPFLALADGEPAGLLLLTFRRRLNFATWEGWVPELVVAEPFRGRGIGRALLRIGIEEWRLRGGHRLSVELERNEAAGEGLLTRMGFEDTFLRFRAEPMAARGRRAPADVVLRAIEPGDAEAVDPARGRDGAAPSPVPERMEAVARTFRGLAARPIDRSLLALRDGDRRWGSAPRSCGRPCAGPRSSCGSPSSWSTSRFAGAGIGAALLDAAMRPGPGGGGDERHPGVEGAPRRGASALCRRRLRPGWSGLHPAAGPMMALPWPS